MFMSDLALFAVNPNGRLVDIEPSPIPSSGTDQDSINEGQETPELARAYGPPHPSISGAMGGVYNRIP
jgi:hypothetical protein